MEMILMHIEGTHLTRHHELVAGLNRPHAWSPIKDRNRMAWYECERCGEFVALRIGNVREHATVSCGCKGSKMFIGYYETRAANLPAATRQAMFNDSHGHVKSRRLSPYQLARKYRVSEYLARFAVLAHKRTIKALAGIYRGAVNVLNKVERAWIVWSVARENDPLRLRQAEIKELPWQNQMSIREAHRVMLAAAYESTKGWTSEMWHALLDNPRTVVEFA